MHGSLGQFKATLQRKKERSDAKSRGNFSRKNTYSSSKTTEGQFDFPKMSDSEFNEFKSKLESKRRISSIKDLAIYFIALIAISIISILIFG